MSGETAPALLSGLSAASTRLTDISYSPPADLPFDDWAVDVYVLGRIQARIPFYLGDAIIFGQNAFGEEYSQALDPDELGLSMQTIYNYVWVCRAIPPERRRPELSWEHHKIVAGQIPDLQDYWLERCIKEHLSTRELRDAMSGKSMEIVEENEFGRSPRKLLGEFLLLPLVSAEERGAWLERLTKREEEALQESAEEAIETLQSLVELL